MWLDLVFEEVGVAAEEILTDARALASCIAQGGADFTVNFGVDFCFVFGFRV